MSETGTVTATAQTGSAVGDGPASLWSDAWRELRRRVTFWVAVAILGFMGLLAAAPWLFTGRGPNDGCDVRQAKLRPASWNPFAAGRHLLGTDSHGCDYWSQIVHGTRAPIVVGFVVTGIALTLAITLGSLSGYYGRLLDMLLSRLTDIFFGLPLLLGALVILTAFPSHGVWTESLVLGLLWWPTMTRLMRGQVLSVRDADYVQAARLLGAGDVRVMARHILPNAIAPVFVYAMLNVGVVIGYEATLDYLGVGLQYPTVSWGLQLSQAQEIFTDYPYLLIYPGLFLTATVLSFLLLGDAVRDALDPKLR
jgi:ABC-type dipeptide/oligopeptide/nickel transport system permease subunit